LLSGRNIGMDFEVRHGFRMYHGERGVPGFPQHSHRGFETITIVPEGLCDHSDSLGAKARFGGGSDTQWVTTGKGIQHAEMFPLVHSTRHNHMLLFQIWLNLDSKNKMVDPYFTMLWTESNPVVKTDGAEIVVICDQNELSGTTNPQPPPPNSWAADKSHDVAILLITINPQGGSWTLPAALANTTNRRLFFYEGPEAVKVDGTICKPQTGLVLNPTADVAISNLGAEPAHFLLLQGRPIGEPVAQRGPFVLNTQQELMQAFVDYQRTQFGGWPWGRSDPVHNGLEQGRFAVHPDGRREEPGKQENKEL